MYAFISGRGQPTSAKSQRENNFGFIGHTAQRTLLPPLNSAAVV